MVTCGVSQQQRDKAAPPKRHDVALLENDRLEHRLEHIGGGPSTASDTHSADAWPPNPLSLRVGMLIASSGSVALAPVATTETVTVMSLPLPLTEVTVALPPCVKYLNDGPLLNTTHSKLRCGSSFGVLNQTTIRTTVL